MVYHDETTCIRNIEFESSTGPAPKAIDLVPCRSSDSVLSGVVGCTAASSPLSTAARLKLLQLFPLTKHILNIPHKTILHRELEAVSLTHAVPITLTDRLFASSILKIIDY